MPADGLHASTRCFPAEQPEACLRLGFEAAENLTDLSEGVRRLGAAARCPVGVRGGALWVPGNALIRGGYGVVPG